MRGFLHHIPHTAGRSLRKSIAGLDGSHLVAREDRFRPNLYSLHFCVVRDPWSLAVSHFNDLGKGEAEFESWIRSARVPMALKQARWFLSPNGDELVDYVGCWNRIEETASTIASMLETTCDLPHFGKREYHNRVTWTPGALQAAQDLVGEEFIARYDLGRYRPQLPPIGG